ncbi:MAG: hypothetical protein DVB35_06830 [Verrucomicrobia bacterium]|nr:MAG: hypothetical protein DVB35_06830 [Verrucomicrobiota bacterium]
MIPLIDSSCDCSTQSVQTQGLTISALKQALMTAPDFPITVIWTDGEPIEAHFHITEIGRVQRDFVDCGGTQRTVITCLLQTWVATDIDHRITAGKLLKAFAYAAPILKDEDLPLELEYQTCNVVQVTVASIAQDTSSFIIRVASKHTDCLAKDVCLPQSNGASCC